MNDFRFAVRQLLKHPGFTAIAVLTLALGIGANTAMFSVINALILRRLPYPQSEQLFWVQEKSKQSIQEPWGGHFLDWQEHSQTLAGIGAYDASSWTLLGEGEPERVNVANASAGLLPALGVHPLPPGRNFLPSEDRPGAEHVAILSHQLWQRRYHAATDIIGRSITLNATSYTVIGILPQNFRFLESYDIWVPLALDPQAELNGPNHSYQTTLVRLKPGVTREQAQTEMDLLQQRYESNRSKAESMFDTRTQLTPLQTYLLGDARRPLLVLWGAVGLVLLIACANVANLLLARAVTRRKELAIRTALGAGWTRLARQLLTECLLLAGIGGAAGFVLAYWLTTFLRAVNSTDFTGRLGQLAIISIDWHVLFFALLVSLITGLLFGLLPALQPSVANLGGSLSDGGRGTKSTRSRLRRALMVAEVAVAIVLLIGAGLLIRSFIRLLEVNPGFRSDHLLTARLQMPPAYRDQLPRIQFYERLFQSLISLPGVAAVGATSHLPLTPYNMGAGIRVEAHPTPAGENGPSAPIASVHPDYFRAMGIELRAGRLLTDGDVTALPPVALLSAGLARRLFPNENPIGKRIGVPGLSEEWTTIVGVVGDIRHDGLDRAIEETVYYSYRQMPRPGMSLVLRTTVEPMAVASALRQTVRAVEPDLPLYDVRTMDDRISRSIAGRRFNLLLLGSFAVLALLLAGVGVYGVIAYVVTERTQEVGIRMALGARPGEVIAMILRQGLSLAALGIALGLLAALALSQVMTTLLYQIKPHDPMTFMGVSALILIVALVASWLPARRAARVDPVVALRAE